MKKPGNLKTVLLVLLIFFSQVSFGQFAIPEKPEADEQIAVYDYIDLLHEYEENRLKETLHSYADTTSTQIVIAIIKSTQGENINFLGAQWGEKWGIGQEDKDNGVLVLVAEKDRKMAISTGRGVEHLLTDAMSKRVIENHIIPEFKRGNFYAGLDNGTHAIFKILQGEYTETRDLTEIEFPLIFVMFIIILLIFLYFYIRSRKSRWYHGPNGPFYDTTVLSDMGSSRSSGWGGGGGFGSGGGFGGGFGGGSFGGGGASGSW